MTGKDMETDNPAYPTTSATPAWLLWVRALLAVAILGAGYLAWVSIHHGPVAGCGAESGCNKVLQSRWAYWLDIPVSVPALLVYLALMGATVLLRKRPAPDDERGSWAAIIALSVIVAGAALWFVGLQVFVIKAFCKFCMTAHACGFVAALLCLKKIPLAVDPDTPMWAAGSGKRGVPRAAIVGVALLGLAGVAVLAGGQLLVQKERNVVKGPRTKRRLPRGEPTLRRWLPPWRHGPSRDRRLPMPGWSAPRVLSLYSNLFSAQARHAADDGIAGRLERDRLPV